MRPEEPAAPWAVDLAPGTDSDAPARWWSAGDHDAAWPKHRQRCLVQRRWIASATHHDGIVVTGPVATNRVEARVQHLALEQPELANDRGQKRDALRARFEKRQRGIRENDLERDAGDPGTRPDVQDPPRAGRQQPHEQQAIEHDVIDDPVWVGGADETLVSLPFKQQFQILIE